jgi:excisionase family DNA binding protein
MGELEPGDRWLTVVQAAVVAGVHASTIRRWCDDGLLASIRTLGNQRRIRLFDLQDAIRGQKPKE